MTLHYYKELIQPEQLKKNGNRNEMECPSKTRDLPTALFSENFIGKIQHIANDNAGRIITIKFTSNKQNFQIITTLYGPNKLHHRENLFQSLTSHITSTQNTIKGGDFNMVT